MTSPGSPQDVQDFRDEVMRLLELQLNQVLSMLHLLEQLVARCLLAARERGQDAMALEQTHDLVAEVLNVLTGAWCCHDRPSSYREIPLSD